MKGLLAGRVAPRTRALALLPAIVVLGILLTLALGLTNALPVALVVVVGFALAVAASIFLLGLPLPSELGVDVPQVSPDRRSWFFPLVALVLAALLYLPLGLLLGPILPPDLAAVIPSGLALVAGLAIAAFVTGVPHPLRATGARWERLDPARRRHLVLPLTLIVALLLLFPLGLVLTALPLPADLVGPLATLLAVASGWGIANRLAGPPGEGGRRNVVPNLAPERRWAALILTMVILGAVLIVTLGAVLSLLGAPGSLVLPVATLVGFGVAAWTGVLLWGRPPRVDPRGAEPAVRTALAFATWLVVGTLLAVLADFVGLDLVPALLGGYAVAILPGAWVAGLLPRPKDARGENAFPTLPDKVKPLLLIPLWTVAGLAVFATLAYVGVPFLWAFGAGALVGLGVAVLVVEEALVRREVASWGTRRAGARRER